VVGISPQQYRAANGHSNRYWGWGGEDNDMEFRLARALVSFILFYDVMSQRDVSEG